MYHDMRARGIERTGITYSSLLQACEKAGRWQLGLELFQEMHRDGIKPSAAVYNALIATCGQGAPRLLCGRLPAGGGAGGGTRWGACSAVVSTAQAQMLLGPAGAGMHHAPSCKAVTVQAAKAAKEASACRTPSCILAVCPTTQDEWKG